MKDHLTRKLTIELGTARQPTWPHDYTPTRTITLEWADGGGAAWRTSGWTQTMV